MNKQIEFVEELFEELHELARWEGCETGDLCHNLMDLWEGSISYASLGFQNALEREIRSLYDTLKNQKDEEEAEKELEKEIFGEHTRVNIKIDDLDFGVTLNRPIDNRNHKDIANALKDIIVLLEAKEVEDTEIF